MPDYTDDKIPYIQTFKSGRFYFYNEYDKAQLESLIAEVRALKKAIDDFPMPPNMLAQFDAEITRRSIAGTTKIEGNPLSEEEVGKVLKRKSDEFSSKMAEKEIQNLKEQCRLIRGIKSQAILQITENQIVEIHEAITTGIGYEGNRSGRYRNHVVHVGDTAHGGVDIPPKIIEDIRKLMGFFIEWMISDKMAKIEPILRAFAAHYYLSLIHPFGDGNGRTARALEAILLQSAGYKYASMLIWEYYSKNVDDYFLAFSKSRKSRDITPFFEFCLKGLIWALNEIKSKISRLINIFVLADYFGSLMISRKLSERQHSLLKLLLEHNIEFSPREIPEKESLRILYKNISTRTIMRDLAKLKSMNLLVEEGGRYRLNSSYLQEMNS